MSAPGAYGGDAPQRWQPGAGGVEQLRQGNGPPVASATMGPPSRQPPPMQGMPVFAGYEAAAQGGFGQMAPLPPPPPPPPPQGNPPPQEFTDIANLSEEACRQAMVEYVSQQCCYGTKPAEEMKITNFQGMTALHYTLETYCESRNTGFKSVPYRGGPVDGPENGPPPPPWAIPCQPDQMFQNQTKLMEVPHTASVRPCHECDARGYHPCWRCHAWGSVRCGRCDGRGRVMEHDHEGRPHEVGCHNCYGTGHERCHVCGGDGRITCDECDGYRNLKSFIQLRVEYVNHNEDHIIERTDMPDELVRTVSGEIVFEQILPQVWPITAYPVAEINSNSVRLVEKHKSAFRNSRQLMQKQQLRAVPVTEVHYSWEDVSTRYWIYGLNRSVHAPDYPQQCCWGCSIL